MQKLMPTPTQTATNQTAEPLCLSASDLRDRCYLDDMRQSITAKREILAVYTTLMVFALHL